jgi:hypothetical protein
MSQLIAVDCPRCAEETFSMIPEGHECAGTSADVDASAPPGVAGSVLTDCHNDHRFVVYHECRE